MKAEQKTLGLIISGPIGYAKMSSAWPLSFASATQTNGAPTAKPVDTPRILGPGNKEKDLHEDLKNITIIIEKRGNFGADQQALYTSQVIPRANGNFPQDGIGFL